MATSFFQFVTKTSTAAALLLFGGLAFGDTIRENGGSPTFTAMPANLTPNNGTPYWNNNSTDGSQKNIGYLLTGTGGFAGGTNYSPQAYLSQAGTPNYPASFNLVRDTNSLIITLLSLNTTDNTNIFGYYDANQTTVAGAQATEHPLFSSATSVPGTSTVNLSAALAASGISNYGFYLMKCANHPACTQSYTFFSNAALDIAPTDNAGHQHFALFTYTADPNIFYVGSEDWFGDVEGLGDYNDMVIRINSDAVPTSVPEPATLGMLAAGLLGVGISRVRRRRI